MSTYTPINTFAILSISERATGVDRSKRRPRRLELRGFQAEESRRRSFEIYKVMSRLPAKKCFSASVEGPQDVWVCVLRGPPGSAHFSRLGSAGESQHQRPSGAAADCGQAQFFFRSMVHLNATNMLKMSWNSEAAANAQEWADTCSLAHSTASQREISTSGCGENIYESNTTDSWESAISAWNSEGENYEYGVGSVNGEQIGHYTQLVWFRSNQVGCAVAHCPNARTQYFYVCQYCPAGNTQLHHPYAEGHPCSACPNNCENNLCTNPCPKYDTYANCGYVAARYSCDYPIIAFFCPASCQCHDKIK
ncbi:hypothetical protein GJAV_G00107510 [Gymnothorax javanicus]|nr:hypothetical protein GJAV_G00107510 [Gymnothorax javanicus]